MGTLHAAGVCGGAEYGTADSPAYSGPTECPPFTTCMGLNSNYAQCRAGDCPATWVCDEPTNGRLLAEGEECPNQVWNQCGGNGFTGVKCCQDADYCDDETDPTWHQCKPTPVEPITGVAPEDCPTPVWHQCGGTNFSGYACCQVGNYCDTT